MCCRASSPGHPRRTWTCPLESLEQQGQEVAVLTTPGLGGEGTGV